MLVNQLNMRVATQQHREVIKPRDNASQLHAVDQKNRHGNLMLPNVVQEYVLYVLLSAMVFFASPPLVQAD